MIRVLHIPSGNFYFKLPFSVNKSQEEGKISVGRGKVVSVYTQDRLEIENSTVDESELSEIYLHIKSSLVSSKIHEVNILNEEEVAQQKELSDDLLNIYLPIGRPSVNGFPETGFKDSAIKDANFLWLKANKDEPFACYFDNNNVYMTGYLLSVDDEPTRVEAPTDRLVPEDYALLLEISATIDEDPSAENFFVLKKYEVKGGTKEECSILVEEDIKKLNDIEYFSGDLEIVYPLGFVENGNFIHGRKPNNISISADNTSQVYHARTIEEDGCPVAEKEDKRKFYITVD